jgi:Flp pilus assembly protein TadG
MQIIRKLGRLTGLLRCDTRGAAAVELAALAPILAALIIPMIDLGMGTYQKMRVQEAAEAGAEYAAVHGFNQGLIQSTATGSISTTGVTAAASQACHCVVSGAISSTTVTCGSTCGDGTAAGNYVTVTTQLTYPMLFPYPGLSTLTIKGSAISRF